MTSNSEYQKSIEEVVRGLMAKMSEDINLSAIKNYGYLDCLITILSYGELPKLYLDKITQTLIKMEANYE